MLTWRYAHSCGRPAKIGKDDDAQDKNKEVVLGNDSDPEDSAIESDASVEEGNVDNEDEDDTDEAMTGGDSDPTDTEDEGGSSDAEDVEPQKEGKKKRYVY